MDLVNLVKKYLIVYLALLFIFLLSITMVSSLPGQAIRNNIRESLPLLEKEGDYPRIGGESVTNQLSTFTDSTMLNIIYNINNYNPIKSGLRNSLYRISGPYKSNLRILSLKEVVENSQLPNIQYARYWNGYMVIIRPLLIFTTFSGIRNFFQIVFFLLFAAIIGLIHKHFSLIICLFFAGSLALVNYAIVPFSLLFSGTFFIAFCAMILFLAYPTINNQNIALLFFIIGAITSFMDLLSTPMLTFGLPAIIVVLLKGLDKKKNHCDIGFYLYYGYFAHGVWGTLFCGHQNG